MIKHLKSLGADSLTYGVADIVGRLIGFILIPIYTSYLTPSDYGTLSLLNYIYLFFTPIASIGISNAIFRRFNLHQSKDKQKLALSTAGLFIVFSSCFLAIIGLLFSKPITEILVDNTDSINLTRIVIIGSLFSTISGLYGSVLRAMRRVKEIAVISVVKLLVGLLPSIYFVVFAGFGVAGIIYGTVIAEVVAFFIYYIKCKEYLSLKLDLQELKALLSYGLPFLPHRLFSQLIIFAGPFFIKEYGNLEEVGLYYIALKFTLPLGFIIEAVQKAWVPLKFQIHREEDKITRKKTFHDFVSIYFFFIFVCFSGTLLFGTEIIKVATTKDFHAATIFFPLLLLSKLMTGFYYMMSTGFEFTNDTKPMPIVSFVGLLTIVIMGYFLSQFFDVIGVIIAVNLAWFVMGIVIRYFALNRFKIPINLKWISIVLIISLVFTFVVTKSQIYDLSVRVLVLAVLFIISIFLCVYVLKFNKEFQQLINYDYPIVKKVRKIFNF